MPLQAGQQATRVRIEASTTARDPETNEDIPTWAVFCEAWLSFDPRAGGEYQEGGGRYSQVVENLTGDFLALRGVTAGMRVIAGGQILDIKAVMPDSDRRGRTKLQCVAGEGAR